MVYTRVDNVGVWSSFRKTHRQGKITQAGTKLTVLSETSDTEWYEIEEPPLDREVNEDYPAFWIMRVDTTTELSEVPEPPPLPDPIPGESITEIEVALALLTVMKWWKQQ